MLDAGLVCKTYLTPVRFWFWSQKNNMPAKKKTNFVSYELARLDKYLKQLTSYLDAHPPDKMEDRIEWIETPRGGEIPKVISSIETQLKVFMSTLEKLPKLLSDVNALRKEVEGGTKEVELRGGAERPGFMDNDEQTGDDFEDIPNDKTLPPSTTEEIKDPEFDDENYWQEDD
jgi:hypothetical protein